MGRKTEEKAKPHKPTNKMMGLRVPPNVANDIEAFAQAMKIPPGQVLRKMVLMGHEAMTSEPVINPRIILYAGNVARLTPENRLKHEVLFAMLEKEVKEMLASQSQ